MWFLGFAKNDTVSAAKRLVLYWKLRCDLFQERAFLPMNQTGEGALDKDDIALLGTGYWTYLPRDKQGRTVVFNDFSRITNDSVTSRMRHMFYANHVVLQNKASVEKGCVFIIFLSQATIDTLKEERQVSRIWNDAFPLSIDSLHVVPKVKNKSFLDAAVPFLLDFFQKFMPVNKNRFVHKYNTTVDLIQTLKRYGLSKEDLPDVLGGDFTFETFLMWQERQMRVEWGLPLGQYDEFEYGNYRARPLCELNKAERTERKRHPR